jgi:hypothetical protein
MAQVDDDEVTNTSTTTFDLKSIDLNDSSLPEGKEYDINPQADAWERACPPPDGILLVQLFEARQPYQTGKTDDGEVFYKASLQCKIQTEGEYHNTFIFPSLTTLISPGKEISTVVGLMAKAGLKNIPSKITPKKSMEMLRKVISMAPSLYCEGEWAAWDNNKKEWIKRGMKNFPRLDNGGYNHLVRDSKGVQVAAKFKVTRWYGKKEYALMVEKEMQRKQGNKTNVKAGGERGEAIGAFNEIEKPVQQARINAVAQQIVKDEDFILDE